MIFRYRVKGHTEKAFILRGMYLRVGKGIDIDVTENELYFVKERCKVFDVIDLQKPTNSLESMPDNKSKSKRGEKGGRTSKSQHKE